VPITVRVRNVQSIADATVEIDGFTVITGANNSGKTAMMRAIRGVFTNAPPGALVRHGAAHLTVDITFDNGDTITWEKGWEKPGHKGKTINSYTVNGKVLENVGRGVPPEVEALGVRQIQAGSDKLWPQIANQFSGTLFLVGSTGSSVAEAVADVERVGKLSAALKKSESDRRSIASTLKVRRKDSETLGEELTLFEGLDSVTDAVETIEKTLTGAQRVKRGIEGMSAIRDSLRSAQGRVEALAGVSEVPVPDGEAADTVLSVRDEIQVLGKIQRRLGIQQGVVDALGGVTDVTLPSEGEGALKVQKGLQVLVGLRDRKQRVQRTIDALEGAEMIGLPADRLIRQVEKIRTALQFYREAKSRLDKAHAEVERLEKEFEETSQEHASADSEVILFIDELGMCPTCRRGTEDGHSHEVVA